MKRFFLFAWLIFWASGAEAAQFIWANRAAPLGSLYLLGNIVPGDYDRFSAALAERGPRPFALYVRSGGGNVGEALRIGVALRNLSATVYAPLGNTADPSQRSCEGDVDKIGQLPSQCICASACTLIWFAGVNRVGMEIHVHSIKFEDTYFGSLSPQEAQKEYRATMDSIREYLHQMDVEDKYYYLMSQTMSSDIQKVGITDDPKLFGWAPGYREWLFSKCGGVNKVNPETWGQCSVSTSNEAQVKAIAAFLHVETPRVVTLPEPPSVPLPAVAPVPNPPPTTKAPSPPSVADRSAWTFYGSRMYAEKQNNGDLAVYFDDPRPSFAEEGVGHGSLFFKGRVDGRNINGALSYYTKNCPTITYSVSGESTNGGQRITLSGVRPRRDTDCESTGSRNVTVTMDMIKVQEARSVAVYEPFSYNGSTFRMTSAGNARVFRYDTPRDELLKNGISSGSVLFKGVFEARSFTGRGVVYTKDCPPAEYEMKGTFADNGRDVVLTGERPVRDKLCRLKRYTRSKITFEPSNAE